MAKKKEHKEKSMPMKHEKEVRKEKHEKKHEKKHKHDCGCK